MELIAIAVNLKVSSNHIHHMNVASHSLAVSLVLNSWLNCLSLAVQQRTGSTCRNKFLSFSVPEQEFFDVFVRYTVKGWVICSVFKYY